jgi:hypothetical protein
MHLRKNCLAQFERERRPKLLFEIPLSPADIHLLLAIVFFSWFEKKRVLCYVVLCSVCLYISGRTEKSTD